MGLWSRHHTGPQLMSNDARCKINIKTDQDAHQKVQACTPENLAEIMPENLLACLSKYLPGFNSELLWTTGFSCRNASGVKHWKALTGNDLG